MTDAEIIAVEPTMEVTSEPMMEEPAMDWDMDKVNAMAEENIAMGEVNPMQGNMVYLITALSSAFGYGLHLFRYGWLNDYCEADNAYETLLSNTNACLAQ